MIDSTHIPCIVLTNLQITYRNRKGFTSQNVIAIIDFDLKFTYMVAEWEGSVHDARVLLSTRSDLAFQFRNHQGVSVIAIFAVWSNEFFLQFVLTILLFALQVNII